MASQGQAPLMAGGLGDLEIYVKDLRNPNNRKRKLVLKSYYTVKDVKDILASHLHVPVTMQRLFFRGRELRNARTLHDSGIDSSFHTVFFAMHRESSHVTWSLAPYDSLQPPKSLAKIINQVKRGLEKGFAPVLSIEGTGGTYFMSDTCKNKLAAFKPKDEEPFAPNNPRGFVGMGEQQVSMRQGIEPGEACIREVAAYLCDEHRFHGVPATTLVEARHPSFCYNTGPERVKLGSFQEFVHHSEVVADISPSKLGTRQVHKIAILDIRLLNGDRNDANILVCRTLPSPNNRDSYSSSKSSSSSQSAELKLVPIDHGYCLPDTVEIGWCDWCWLDWPQIKKPLDKETLKFVLSLDPKADAERLGRKLSLREPCLRNFRAAEMLLVAGVKAGLTLYDIANIIVRHDLDKKSELERIMQRAKELARAAVDNTSMPKSLIKSNNKTSSPWHHNGNESETITRNVIVHSNDVCGCIGCTPHRSNEIHNSGNQLYEDVGLSIDDEADETPKTEQLCTNGHACHPTLGPNGDVPLSDVDRDSTSGEELSNNNHSNSNRKNSVNSMNSDVSSVDICESPLGFWRERMEDIDARNTDRPFVPWPEPKTPDNELNTSDDDPIQHDSINNLNFAGALISRLQPVLEIQDIPVDHVVLDEESKLTVQKNIIMKKNGFVRSYSYHGLRSEALYDSPDRSNGKLLKGRHNDNSEHFKNQFFKLLGGLIEETIKRVQRHKKLGFDHMT